MKRTTTTAAATLVVATGLFGWHALAQTANNDGQGRMMGDKPMMMDRSEMGMSDEMKMCMKMNMQAKVAPNDPAALLAVREDLSLTEQQTEQLRDLVEETRQAAMEVLTDEQRRQIDALPDEPRTMMQMHQQMMQSMKKRDGDGGMMNCPMMDMMGPGSQAAQ